MISPLKFERCENSKEEAENWYNLRYLEHFLLFTDCLLVILDDYCLCGSEVVNICFLIIFLQFFVSLLGVGVVRAMSDE